ncbi:hypothetical protein BD31_I1837, partial [Candidatus Nitrosopumilus salaria BD31]
MGIWNISFFKMLTSIVKETRIASPRVSVIL